MKTRNHNNYKKRNVLVALGSLTILACLAAPVLSPYPVYADGVPPLDTHVLTTNKRYIGGRLDHNNIWNFISNRDEEAKNTDEIHH